MPDIVDFEFVWQRRARTHEGHLSRQNVPKLRKFIEARLPKESPDRCDSVIFRDLVNRFSWFRIVDLRLTGNKTLNEFLVYFGITVCVHGSEFQTLEPHPELSEPLLPKNDRTFGSQLDCNRYGG